MFCLAVFLSCLATARPDQQQQLLSFQIPLGLGAAQLLETDPATRFWKIQFLDILYYGLVVVYGGNRLSMFW